MTNIATCKTWPDQAVADSLQVKMTSVYERREGASDKGPWSVQNCVVEDATGEIRVSVWNHEDISHLQGQTVSIASTPGKGGKSSGVKVKHGKFKDKPTIELEVGKGGRLQAIEVGAGMPIKGPSGANVGPLTPSEGQSSPPAASGPYKPKEQREDERSEGQRRGMITKMSGDYVLALMAAGNNYSEDEFVGMVKSIFPKLLAASHELDKA